LKNYSAKGPTISSSNSLVVSLLSVNSTI
jgi:hypothetical protein